MPARRQAQLMFCNSSARASIPSRALISFSRVLMVLLLEGKFSVFEQPKILPPESRSTPCLHSCNSVQSVRSSSAKLTWANAKNWAEALGTKTVVKNVAVAGGNAGKIVDYSLTAGTATTAASELSGMVSSALTVGSKLALPLAAVATWKDLLAHAGCAVKSVIGFVPTLVP